MLTPEDFGELGPKLEEIRQLLEFARAASEQGLTDEAHGYYTWAMVLMEELVDEVDQKQGHSIRDALKRIAEAANSPEGAGAIGGVAAGASVPAFLTGLGSVGIAAGGTAFGLGVAAASGGVGLAGAAAAYLAYRAGAKMLETEPGKNAVTLAREATKAATEQVKSAGSNAAEGVRRVRDRLTRGGDNEPPEQQ